MNTVDYPTPDDVDRWDDASLNAAAGCEAALRYGKLGWDALNDAERVLCCCFLLESEVNNGGFGQWIWNVCPQSAAETPRALRAIGAEEMAAFVGQVLSEYGDPAQFRSRDEWLDYYQSRPDEVHEHLETLTRPYQELEGAFLRAAYAFARTNWHRVRNP